MNIGNNASACSGTAFVSNTARAAAQHKSSVSVSSMAPSRIALGMFFCTVIIVSNGFAAFMSCPLMKLICVRTISVFKRAARLFHCGVRYV